LPTIQHTWFTLTAVDFSAHTHNCLSYQAVANGVSGAWNETDALGIHNVFRYAFDKPTGAFENPPLLGIAFASDGTALVLTPPLVNTAGFDLSLLATDDLAGANPATFPLDPSGTNAVPASSSSTRFFRLKAAER